MKAPVPIPQNILIIEREAFLSAVEKRGHILLRAQTENPNNHLLVIFSDTDEKYAVVVETGPNAEYVDLRQAYRHTPPGLAVRYIVPCAHCPPYAIPKGLAQTQLPNSLASLHAPPAAFGESLGHTDTEPESEVPAPVVPTLRSTRHPLPPVVKPHKIPVEEPAPAEPSRDLSIDPGVAIKPEMLSAQLSRSLQDIEKSLAERAVELRRRETAIRERELALEKDRKLLEEEAGHISAGVENREIALARRENELQSKAESLVRAMRDIDEIRRNIESVSSKLFPTGR